MQISPSVPATPAAPLPAGGDVADREFAAWVGRQLRPVWRYLRMHGAAPDAADDLTQEVFVLAWQKGAHGLAPAAAAAFLRRTARFVFLRHLRDRRAAVALADAVDLLWERDCAADGGDGLVAALRECVALLDGRARRAVELSYGNATFAAAPRVDAAVELGLRPNGLKTLLQRVRQQLRACIERRRR